MTDQNQAAGNESASRRGPSSLIQSIANNLALVVYLLYFAGLAVPAAGLVGVIVAYVNRDARSALDLSHFSFQIGTFWKGLLGAFIGAILAFVVIGWFVLLAVYVWWIIRCVKGMKWLSQGVEVPNPSSWMFGD
jgi:uncharacterized membrane protein